MASLKNDLAQHNLTLEDAIELALNKPLSRLLAASGWCMPNNDDDDDDDDDVINCADTPARFPSLLSMYSA